MIGSGARDIVGYRSEDGIQYTSVDHVFHSTVGMTKGKLDYSLR